MRRTPQEMARRLAQDIPKGSYVNLGIGLPTLVGDAISPQNEICLHSENGILHFGASEGGESADPFLINASKQPVGLLAGAAIFDSALSFAMMRGGHLDLAVLGAYEVAENGDLANWTRGDPGIPPAVGGALELAYGAKEVWVLMPHVAKNGALKIVRRCRLPLTARGVVTRIYTDLAVLHLRPGQLVVEELVQGLSLEELQALTEPELHHLSSLRSSTT